MARRRLLSRYWSLRLSRGFGWVGGLLAIGFLSSFSPPLTAQDVLPLPSYAPVVDQVGVLTDVQKQAVTAKLRAFEDTYGAQVAVVVLASTKPEPIEDYANRLANTWKLGREGVGDGVVMVLARDDRRVRVEVSRALEGALPDLAVKRVLEDVVVPALKNADFHAAIDEGVDALLYQMASEEKGQVGKPPGKLETFLRVHSRQAAWAGGIVGGGIFILLIGMALIRLRRQSAPVSAGSADDSRDTEPPSREPDTPSATNHRSGGGGDYAGGGATDRW